MALVSGYLSVALSMLKISKFREEMKSLTHLVLLLSIRRRRKTKKKISPDIYPK